MQSVVMNCLDSVLETAATPVPDAPAVDGFAIRLGGLNKLEVPAEDIGADDGGQDIDFSAQMTPPIRKPEQYEKFSIFPSLALRTRLLAVRSGAGGIETKFYFVDRKLRNPVSTGIRDAMVLPWWSYRDKRWCLWIINYNPGNTWFDSIQPLLQQPAEFYADKAFTVESDRTGARYCVRSHAAPSRVPSEPGRTVNEMLGMALGPKGFINTTDHPVYQQLTSGEDVR
jgi:hypothetical protein